MSDRRKTKFMTLGFKIPFSIMTTNKSTAKILNTTYIYSIGRDNEKLCYILTEIDEKPAIALTLVLGKNHYTGNVVFLLAVFFLVEKIEAKF